MPHQTTFFTFETFKDNCRKLANRKVKPGEQPLPIQVIAFAVLEELTPADQYQIYKHCKKAVIKVPGIGLQTALELVYWYGRRLNSKSGIRP